MKILPLAHALKTKFSYLAGKLFKIDGERICPDQEGAMLEGHLNNYRFMSQFVKEAKVLDIGCGYGYGSNHLLEQGAAHVHGIDYSRGALRFSRKRYPSDALTFSRMDAQQLAFPDASFDVVTSLENLEHLPDPERCIAEAHRVLRPGGLLLIATPNKELSSPNMEVCPNPHHVMEFYYSDLKGLLESHFENSALFETQITGSEVSEQLRQERIERGEVGLDGTGEGTLQVGPYTVDLTHCKNSHSFIAMAWDGTSPASGT